MEVTDEGLRKLAQVPNLQHLNISRTSISRDAVELFQVEHPGILIQGGN
jgi:hypothetical protein